MRVAGELLRVEGCPLQYSMPLAKDRIVLTGNSGSRFEPHGSDILLAQAGDRAGDFLGGSKRGNLSPSCVCLFGQAIDIGHQDRTASHARFGRDKAEGFIP